MKPGLEVSELNSSSNQNNRSNVPATQSTTIRKTDQDSQEKMKDGEPFDSQMNEDLLIGGDKSEYPGDNQKVKWKSLEHRGVTFFQGYEPHGVKLLHKVSH